MRRTSGCRIRCGGFDPARIVPRSIAVAYPPPRSTPESSPVRNRVVLIFVAIAIAAGLGFVLFGSNTPEPPSAAPPAADGQTAPVPVEFEVVRLSREGMGVVAGSAAPGGFVDVMSEGRSIGKSRASATGAWEIVISTAMPPGTHILSLAATDGAGNEVRSSDVAVVFVPQPPEEGPDLKTAKGEKKPAADDGVLAVMLPREGGMAGRVLQRPGQLKPALSLGIELAEFDAAGRTVLGGRATVGDTVNVYLDGRPVATVAVEDDGGWTATIPTVTAAPHNIRLEEIDPGNAVVQNVSQAFNPAITLAVDADADATVLADRTVWHVVRRVTGGATRYLQVFRPDQGVAEGKDGDNVKVPGILKPGSDI